MEENVDLANIANAIGEVADAIDGVFISGPVERAVAILEETLEVQRLTLQALTRIAGAIEDLKK